MKKVKLIAPTFEEDLEIQRQIETDPDVPEWTDEMFAKAKRGRPTLPESEKRQSVSIKLDPRVIAYFKGDNPKGWQTRVNAALQEIAGVE